MTLLFRALSNALALAVYFGYYQLSDPIARGQVYYAMCGLLMVWAGLCMHAGWRPPAFACALMMIEGGQQAVFGAFDFGPPTGVDLGPKLLGDDLYHALVSLTLAGLVAWQWPTRQAK